MGDFARVASSLLVGILRLIGGRVIVGTRFHAPVAEEGAFLGVEDSHILALLANCHLEIERHVNYCHEHFLTLRVKCTVRNTHARCPTEGDSPANP
jgi:hypothetical protein